MHVVVRSIVVIAVVFAGGCGGLTLDADGNDSPSDLARQSQAEECLRRDGLPIVWAEYDKRVGPRLMGDRATVDTDGWLIAESIFFVMSSYWAQEPNWLFVIDAAARHCVGPGDAWMLVADPPDIDWAGAWTSPHETKPVVPDSVLWRAVTAHPWRWDSIVAPDGSVTAPTYSGVVRFSDQIAVTSSACDTRIYLVGFVGGVLVPQQWGDSTMVCVPPPGIEPLPGIVGSYWHLPLEGQLTLDGDVLVITDQRAAYRYVAITDEEFNADFDRESFFQIDDPLNVLTDFELDSFEPLDSPPPDTTTTTSTVAP